MDNSIQIDLGSESEIERLFPNKPDGLNECRYIEHTINQTLLRDQNYGGWSCVFTDNGQYGAKMASPTGCLESYRSTLKAFLDAGALARSIYDSLKITDNQLLFLLPLGLPMQHTKSIQLLHFPPTECLTYNDYLYSPTNRRWESMLSYNGLPGQDNTLYERIVDAVPIAAPGGDSTGIAPYNTSFIDYGKAMLKALLSPVGDSGFTQPVVAYGGPVRSWLEAAYPEEVKQQVPGGLEVLSTLELPFSGGSTKTQVLCANHPSMYFYMIDDPKYSYGDKAVVMQQDLVAGGWQIEIADDPGADSAETLGKLTKKWATDSEEMKQVIAEQDSAFGFAHRRIARPAGMVS